MSATSDAAAELEPEDAKLVTLARSARARTGAPEGAAVRDDIGRTYAAATVDLPSLHLSAMQAAVAAAVSSGSPSIEAVCLVREAAGATLDEADRLVAADVGARRVLVAGPDGLLSGPPRAAG